MKLKNLVPVLSTLACCLGNPSQVDARTPAIINGTCDYISGYIIGRRSVNCVVIDEGDGGYTTNIIDAQVHVNVKTNEMYVNGRECDPPILAVVNNEKPHIYSICGGTDDDFTVVIPTR